MISPASIFQTDTAKLGSQITFAANSKLKVLQAADAVQVNVDAAEFGGFTKLEALQAAAAQADGSAGPRLISNQILLEPLKAISGDAAINQSLAANATMAEAVTGKAGETIDKLAPLSQQPEKAGNKNIKECLKSAATKCTTLTQLEANQAELAHGNTLEASFASKTIAANAVRLHSDTTISQRSPHIGLNTQDYHVQANNSAVLVADTSLNQTRQAVNLVEGSLINQAQTTLHVSTESHDTISKHNRQVGVESYSSLGKSHTSVADESMVALSGGDIATSAYKGISQRAGGDISIVSSPTAKGGESNLKADGSGVIRQERAGHIMLLGSDGQSTTNVIALTADGNINSSTGSSFTGSSKYSIFSGKQGAISTSPAFTFMGSPTGGLMVKGRRVFINTLPSFLSNFEAPKVTQIPGLPSLPQLPTQSLENCLPKQASQAPEDSLPSSTVRSAPADLHITPKERTLNNSKQVARPLTPGSQNQASKVGRAPNKLPGITLNDRTDTSQATIANISGSNALDVGGISGAGLNIYLAAVDELPAVSLTNSLINGSLSTALNSQEVLNYGLQEALKITAIDQNLIKAFLSTVVPAAGLIEFNNPDLFKLLAPYKNKLSSLKLSDFVAGTDATLAKQAIKLLTAYPKAIPALEQLITKLQALPAIGFLGAVTSLLSGLNIPGLNNIVKAAALPNIISSGNPSQLINLISDYLPANGLTGIASSVLSGDTNQIQNAIQGALTAQLGKLGLDSGITNSVSGLLSSLQAGKPLDVNNLLANLGKIAGVDQAQSIYQTIQPLINKLSAGDIVGLVTGTDLSSLITQVLGSQNAGAITKALGILKQGVGTVEALASIPQLLSLMESYNLPALDQLNLVLSCLDLFNKIKGLLDSLKGHQNAKGNDPDIANIDTANLIEGAGRFTQVLNSIQALSPEALEQLIANIGTVEDNPNLPSLLNQVQTLKYTLSLDACFRVPKLTLAEAELTVIKLEAGRLEFSLDNLENLRLNTNKLPGEGDTVQLYMRSFIDGYSLQSLSSYQSANQYTPTRYSYTITEFDPTLNKGVAIFKNNFSSIVLEDEQGILYEYSPLVIGVNLNPDILEAYLLL